MSSQQQQPPTPFSRRGRGVSKLPPLQPPLYHNPNNLYFLQSPIINPNNFPNLTFNPHNQLHNNQKPNYVTIETMDEAVVRAHREMIVAGDHVTAMKVSRATLVLLKANSWESLGVQMQHVPSLYRLMLIEGKAAVLLVKVVGNGIVNVPLGNEKMTWFVKSHKLETNHIRHDIQTTEISMALMLEDSSDGNYIPKFDYQPIFAYLPLRNYGLKFIVQADFIIPSQKEEVDGDSPWNQWLLSEFPNLFVGAELSFCSLPCFKENPAKGVSVFMSFVPLGGEVHGFFTCLPHMIISKLRESNCLLLEGDVNEWVPPCKVVRNWTEQTRSLLPDSLIKEYLGIGYLNKDIVLMEPLARALGVEECGSKLLVQIMTSLCHADSLKSMGLNWISSWLNVLYLMTADVFEHNSLIVGTQSDVIGILCQLPFIPLLDGKYASINKGTIWLHTDENGFKDFEMLYSKLRIVNPDLLNVSSAENIIHMLYKIGVRQLSAHEVLKVHILPAISDEKVVVENTELMIEYLSFVMFHLESSCLECLVDKEQILSQLRNNAFISTNDGYKRLVDSPIHFCKEFGNPVDMSKLVGGTDMQWFEIDNGYLKHPVFKSSPEGILKWRKFLKELGVTDFVHIVKVSVRDNTVLDYDSQELKHLLSHISLNGDREKSKYLLEVLDTLWDDCFSDKIKGRCSLNGKNKPCKSSVIRILSDVRWMASSMDDQLHFPKDLFNNFKKANLVFGDNAPYAIPKVSNVKLSHNLGLKNSITVEDALSLLNIWRRSEKPFKTSISQMLKFYTYIWNESGITKRKIVESLHSEAFIFVPYSFDSMQEVVSGLFLSPNEVYWQDYTGSIKQTKSTLPQLVQHNSTHSLFSKLLHNLYPGLHSFFVKEFRVVENPPLPSYFQALLQLSAGSLPSQAAKIMFDVFRKWSDRLDSGDLSSDVIDHLKKCMEEKEMTILPTMQDKWVSLHQSFGLICWCDSEQLRNEFKNLNNIDFLYFGELTCQEKQMLQDKISVLFRRLGIPSLSEVMTREAIYSDKSDCIYKTSLVRSMAESGSTEEQMEFITSTQKLLKFPSEESLRISSMSSSEEEKETSTTNSGLSLDDLNPLQSSAKILRKRVKKKSTEFEFASNSDVTEVLVESNGDRIIEENVASTMPSVIFEEESLTYGTDVGNDTVFSDMNAGFTVVTRNESGLPYDSVSEVKDNTNEEKSAKIIESIRRDEFGLDPDNSAIEDSILKKQHARLGRALHCLSQELYSQDSHFLLELVQNADDNMYPCDVEPTLTFILLETGIIVLNNEQGFSVENIKALCDVGNSTKKESNAGYIGKKGIGFKSVFRVTDAPEIHSNGFHIKFDISDGQVGFVLPTIVPPCDINFFSKLVSENNDSMDEKRWNTCIVLPFRSKKNEAFSVENPVSMFFNLHPSLLLFLHRLECISFRNLLNNSLVIMRKEVIGNGIVNVSLGKEKMAWFVKSHKLEANHIRHDVQTTEISIAFMLEDSGNGNYISKLDQQPVFAFLPLRKYGLKFIIQGDFVLPSSREEVDGDSLWNKWLLSEFPNLFVSAELSFCSLSCFKENPAKGVSVFMSFVPLGGEVQGFFSCLPSKIITKLRKSNCLLLERERNEWAPPCKVLRNWTEQTRSLLPDSLIKKHLGVGYLNKDIVLTDSLARALGVEECGPQILLQIMTSLCQTGSLKSMGHSWLSSWLNVLYLMSLNGTQSDVIRSLCQLPFIPLWDGKYASIKQGAIWLNTNENGLEAFEKLYSKLQVVNPALYNDSPVENIENITQILFKVGVQRLSAHDVLKVLVLPGMSTKKGDNSKLLIEYLSFIMFHLESSCLECLIEKENILLRLRNSAFISTNHGYKRLVDVPIHFSKEFGNPVDMSKLVGGTDLKWCEIDISYLNHPVYKSSPEGTLKWRKFLQEIGVTDFVQVVKVEKHIKDISHTVLKNMMLDDDCILTGSTVKYWDSQEFMDLLSHVASNGDREKGKYLLEILDTLWDDYFSDKPFKSSILRILHGVRWLASSVDDKLQFSKDLFHNCETVHAVVGDNAPYAMPMVNSVKLLNDIGLKHLVTLDDVLSLLEVWKRSVKPFNASISQMSNFYTYIWNAMSTSKQKIMESLHSQAFIFVPYSFGSMHEIVSGSFLSPGEVYWHDSTGSMEQMKSTYPRVDLHTNHLPFSKMLFNVYPGHHYFFVNEFGIAENPPLLSYLQSLRHLSTAILPSQAAKTVFQVFQKWSDGLDSGLMTSDDINLLKKSMEEKEMTVLPTVQDKWVSLHQSFGLLCWCDDEQLKKEFKNLSNIDFLCLGELTTQEKQILQDKVSVLFQKIGIPALSEVVTREAIYYGPSDDSFNTSLVNWGLPFAQRYIYSIHPKEYSQLKLTGFSNLDSLRIVMVEKLFYKNVIKRFGIESDNQYKCTCLLQDHILYTTSESDSHSLFMDFFRFLVTGVPKLPLANFLHMITIMAESGSTEEQMEFFLKNSQKIMKLPSEESLWSISSMSSPKEDEDFNPSKRENFWPPAHWKTATPHDVAKDLIETGVDWIIEESSALTFSLDEEAIKDTDIYGGSEDESDYGMNMNIVSSDDMNALVDSFNRLVITRPLAILEKNKASKDQSDSGTYSFSSNTNDESCEITRQNGRKKSSSDIVTRDKLTWRTSLLRTGKTGESVAFHYFSAKLGEKNRVIWVNEVKESGLPYDIIVEGNDDDSKEYIEVKATKYAKKELFEITVREWQFAVEKGESFTIACVVLSDGKSARITTYKDPLKLCKSGHLRLAFRSSNK